MKEPGFTLLTWRTVLLFQGEVRLSKRPASRPFSSKREIIAQSTTRALIWRAPSIVHTKNSESFEESRVLRFAAAMWRHA
jgi:hypothetical protein